MPEDQIKFAVLVRDAEAGDEYEIDDLSPEGLSILAAQLEELLQKIRQQQ